MQDVEMINTVGGAISGTLVNAIIKGIGTLLDLGRTLGTSIRMAISKKKCKVKI